MKTMMSAVLAAGLALAVAGTAYAALDAAAVIKARQDAMKDQGAAMKGLFQGLNAGTPPRDLQVFSAKLKRSSTHIGEWFPAGSGPESGVKTHAKTEIWSDAAGFRASIATFNAAATKLDGVVEAGDADAAKAALGEVKTACGGCHDKYKSKD